jgi:hypothetical protein
MHNARFTFHVSHLVPGVVLALILGAGAATAYAQSGGGYDLSWWTVDGGGGTANGASYILAATAGQPEPGPAASGGGYTLRGGVWHGADTSAPGHGIYLPFVVRNF